MTEEVLRWVNKASVDCDGLKTMHYLKCIVVMSVPYLAAVEHCLSN